MANRRVNLTPKQQKVCQMYLKGMSMREALIAAGFSESYAKHMAYKFLKRRNVVEYIRKEQKLLHDFESYDRQHFYKFLVGKLADSNVEDREKVQYAKLLQQLGGFNKDFDLKEKELEAKIKEVESDKQAAKVFKLVELVKEEDE